MKPSKFSGFPLYSTNYLFFGNDLAKIKSLFNTLLTFSLANLVIRDPESIIVENGCSFIRPFRTNDAAPLLSSPSTTLSSSHSELFSEWSVACPMRFVRLISPLLEGLLVPLKLFTHPREMSNYPTIAAFLVFGLAYCQKILNKIQPISRTLILVSVVICIYRFVHFLLNSSP